MVCSFPLKILAYLYFEMPENLMRIEDLLKSYPMQNMLGLRNKTALI